MTWSCWNLEVQTAAIVDMPELWHGRSAAVGSSAQRRANRGDEPRRHCSGGVRDLNCRSPECSSTHGGCLCATANCTALLLSLVSVQQLQRELRSSRWKVNETSHLWAQFNPNLICDSQLFAVFKPQVGFDIFLTVWYDMLSDDTIYFS